MGSWKEHWTRKSNAGTTLARYNACRSEAGNPIRGGHTSLQGLYLEFKRFYCTLVFPERGATVLADSALDSCMDAAVPPHEPYEKGGSSFAFRCLKARPRAGVAPRLATFQRLRASRGATRE
ncbi:unnamed protein product [Scytosiphon promiscuus]